MNPRRPIPVHTYVDGSIFRPAAGRAAPRAAFTDLLAPAHAVIDLVNERVSAEHFVAIVDRELKIRFYRPRTRTAYRNIILNFLRWCGADPSEIGREHVRGWLELLVDGGASASTVTVHLSAIRTGFDKLCGAGATLGLVTPRRASRLPVVLARDEVARLLQAAPSLRDKLLLGLLYATGMRVGEVVRLRARDLDPARGFIRVVDGKGRKDRDVMLPASFGPLLLRFQAQAAPEAFLFSATAAPDAHMVVRSAQRAMARALALAGITKNATCHSLRHAFATHLLEAGTDIRFIQKLLGHLQLETTTLYTRLAVLRPQSARSPLDTLVNTPAGPRELSVAATPPPPVGRFSLKLDVVTESTGRPSGLATLVLRGPPDVALGGIRVVEQRPGFVSIELPTLETWDAALARVPADVRARLEEPAFYARLQGALSERWMRARG